jgi:glucose 1-dehydrogenase
LKFANKVAIITGGGSGIGRATAIRLAREGAKIVIADISEPHGESVRDEIIDFNGTALFVKTNIAEEKDLEHLVHQTLHKYKRIDIVINNAAIMTFCPVVDIKLEDWDRVIHTNLRSVFLMTKLTLPHINGGAIVNLSSVHAHETTPNNSPYAASKGGIEAFTRAISLEIKPDKVRVNCVAPGAVNTPMLWNNPNVKSGKEKVLGRIAEPDEVAAAIVFLASSDASNIHGTSLIVDGGRLAIL